MATVIINRSFAELSRTPDTDVGIKSESFLASTFSDLIDVMDIAMWQLDTNYRVVGYNKKAKQIYGEMHLGISAITLQQNEIQFVKSVLPGLPHNADVVK